MGKRPFVRFYHLDWSADTDVDNMTMEEVGTYWTLLVRQMVEGFVATDRAKLRKRLNVETVEDVDRLLTPAVLSKFVPFDDDPTKLYNRRLAEIIKETDAASWRGASSAGARWGGPVKSLEEALASPPSPEEPRGVFDFGPILKDYPRRNTRAGEEEGLRIMQDTITEPDTYQMLWAAVKNYSRQMYGRDRRYVSRLDNFMRDWRGYVPAGFKPAVKLKLVEDKPATEEKLTVTEEKPVVPATTKRSDRERPPWAPLASDSPTLAARRQIEWPPERRKAWEEGKE